MCGVHEQWEASVSKGGGEWFDDVDDFEIQHGEECDFGRSGFKVGVNECEFVIGIRFQVEELLGKSDVFAFIKFTLLRPD